MKAKGCTMSAVLKSGLLAAGVPLAAWSSMDQKQAVGDIVFIGPVPEGTTSSGGSSRPRKRDVKRSVGFRIDGGIQPVALVGALDHDPKKENAIRLLSVAGLRAGFLYSVVHGGPIPSDTQRIHHREDTPTTTPPLL